MHLLIDNYDSFTFNIAQAMGTLGEEVHVVRNDEIDVAGVRDMDPETIIISPGPGRPDDAGISKAIIANFADKLPKYGGIGSFGIQGTTVAVDRDMLDKEGDYGFASGKVYNLESSKYIAKKEGASGAHSDIAVPQVAHAIWQAALVS